MMPVLARVSVLLLCADTVMAASRPVTAVDEAGSGEWAMRLRPTTGQDRVRGMALTSDKMIVTGTYHSHVSLEGGTTLTASDTRPHSWAGAVGSVDATWTWAVSFENSTVKGIVAEGTTVAVAGVLDSGSWHDEISVQFTQFDRLSNLDSANRVSPTAWFGFLNIATGAKLMGLSIANVSVMKVVYGGSSSWPMVGVGALLGNPLFGSHSLSTNNPNGRDGWVAAVDITLLSKWAWAVKVDNSTLKNVGYANGHVFVIGHIEPGFETTLAGHRMLAQHPTEWIGRFDRATGSAGWSTPVANVDIRGISVVESQSQILVGGSLLVPAGAPNATWTFGSTTIFGANHSSFLGAVNTSDGAWLWAIEVENSIIKDVNFEQGLMIVMGQTRPGVTGQFGTLRMNPDSGWIATLDISSAPGVRWVQLLQTGVSGGTEVHAKNGKIYGYGDMNRPTTVRTQLPPLSLSASSAPSEILLISHLPTDRNKPDVWLWGTAIRDTMLPLLQSHMPTHLAVNQSSDLNLVFHFDETIVKATETEKFVYLTPVASCTQQFDRYSHTLRIGTASSEMSVNGSVLTINPTQQLLPYGLRYSVSFDPGAVMDLSGNSFTGILGGTGSNFTGEFEFTTESQFAFAVNNNYSVSSSALAAGPIVVEGIIPQTNAHRTTPIEITFSRAIKLGFGDIYLTSTGGSDANEHRTYDVSTNDTQLTLINNQRTLRIVPNSDLDNRGSKTFTLVFGECTVMDANNVPFSGLTSAQRTQHVFFVADTDPPVVINYSPAQQAIGVSRSDNIVLTFNESVVPHQGHILLTPTAGDRINLALRIPVPPLDTISRNRLVCVAKVCTIDPRQDLDDEANTTWTITIPLGTFRDAAGNPFGGMSGDTYSFHLQDVTPEVYLEPELDDYASTRPPLTYKTSPFESHMGPARVYGEDGFSHPGFRSLDGLAFSGQSTAVAREAMTVTREQLFADAVEMIEPGTNYHESPLAKTVVVFSYHSISYPNTNGTEIIGAPFDDVSGWTFHDQLSASLFGGQMNGFGSFYAGNAYVKGFTCMSWSRTDRVGYESTLAYRLHPVAGLPNLLIYGKLESERYNSRPAAENSTISWKLVRYYTDDLTKDFQVITSGKYLVRNVGTETPVIVEGNPVLGDLPREHSFRVDNFVTGSIALVVENAYTEEIPSYGHILVCDAINYRFSPQIPFTVSLKDESPLLVDPANGTIYNMDLTMGMADQVGALWHTAKAVVGYGFDTTFKFKISEISRNCKVFPELSKWCDPRSGDGFAFVIQNGVNGSAAVGSVGRGCGYDGLDNALAVEFDTWYNAEDKEPYNNHISIHAGGQGELLSSHHRHSLASTTDIRNLADEKEHTVRITYNNTLDLNGWITRHRGRQPLDRWQASVIAFNRAIQMMHSDSERYRPGLMSIYLDDMTQPLLQVPLNLAAILGLDAAGPFGAASQTTKAWVGFTASTGSAWQRHTINSWEYTALKNAHAPVMREEYCAHHMLAENDYPMCHLPRWSSRPEDRFTDQHVGRDPKASEHRGDGHGTHPEYGGGHPETIFNTNFDKFYKPQMLTHPHLRKRGEVDQPAVLSHFLPSDGRVEGTRWDKDIGAT